jgi:DNA-binding transcriptional LysR family regulator
MLSWDDFRFVRAVAHAHSLAAAAHLLGVNHSTVFRRLGQIETRLGSRLFERNRNGYSLTPCGEEMVRLAENMENDICAFERQITGRDLRPSGDLRVTTNDAFATYLLPEIFAAFRRAYPEITLDVVISSQHLDLSKRDADVAVRATYRPPDTMVGRRVAVFACAVFGTVESQQEYSGSDLIAHASYWIGLSDNLAGTKMAKWMDDNVPPERVVYRVNSMLGRAEAAAAGIGVALMPSGIGYSVPGLVQLGPTIPDVGAELWLLTHPDLRQAARVRAFMDFVAAELAKKRKLIEGTASSIAA